MICARVEKLEAERGRLRAHLALAISTISYLSTNMPKEPKEICQIAAARMEQFSTVLAELEDSA